MPLTVDDYLAALVEHLPHCASDDLMTFEASAGQGPGYSESEAIVFAHAVAAYGDPWAARIWFEFARMPAWGGRTPRDAVACYGPTHVASATPTVNISRTGHATEAEPSPYPRAVDSTALCAWVAAGCPPHAIPSDR